MEMLHAVLRPTPKKRKKSLRKRKENGDEEIEQDEIGEETAETKEMPRKPTAMEVIGEILHPTLKIPTTKGPYRVPKAVHAGDVNALKQLDEHKLMELKEVFTLFDVDGDGFISENDLRATFIALGSQPSTVTIKKMLKEAIDPLDLDSFVILMGYKTLELDPEDVLLEAWSKWDLNRTGFVSEERILYDLTTFGDRFTENEAEIALEAAPLVKRKPPNSHQFMIDYQAFSKILAGLRKRIE